MILKYVFKGYGHFYSTVFLALYQNEFYFITK